MSTSAHCLTTYCNVSTESWTVQTSDKAVTPEREKLYVLFTILFVIEHDAWRGYHDMRIHSHSGFTLKIINSMNKDKKKRVNNTRYYVRSPTQPRSNLSQQGSTTVRGTSMQLTRAQLICIPDYDDTRASAMNQNNIT